MPAANPKWDVLVVGSINRDYLIKGKRLPHPGESLLGEEFQINPGGKGANQAIAAARLGARVAMIGRAGSDTAEVRAHFRENGVHCRYVTRSPDEETGAALILVDDAGEKMIMAAPGANFSLSERHLEEATACFNSCSVLLIQLEIPVRTALAAMRKARQAGARIVFDPAPPVDLPKEIYPLIDVIRPNSSEAEALIGMKVKDEASARKAARRFLELGVSAAALQAGDGGDLLVWRDGEQWLPRLKVRSVDATGAGDAFAAGLAVGLAEGRGYSEAGMLANAAAALATTKVGAQSALPARKEVEELLRAKQGKAGRS